MRLPGFLRNFRDRFVREDYVDETDLFDTKEMLADTRARMKKALRKLRERPQKLEDFPDNRMKLRFAFPQILKKRSARCRGADPQRAAKPRFLQRYRSRAANECSRQRPVFRQGYAPEDGGSTCSKEDLICPISGSLRRFC